MTAFAAEHVANNGRAPSYRLLSPADLAALPAPAYLLDAMIPAAGLAVLFGPSGTGKSFLALDWSLCIATGTPWHGQVVQAGLVVYLAAEGVAGLALRIAAWREHHDVEPERVRFIPDAVNLLDAASVERARATIDALDESPVLIVVDTMARSLVGGDENSARDVGQFIANVDDLRASFNAAALVVHHTGKDGDAERGSSALRGAADAMLALRPDGGGVKLESVKAKDAERFASVRMVLAEVHESCVFELGSNPGALSVHEQTIIETLTDAFGSDEVATSKLRLASGVAERTFYRAIKSLEDRELVERRQEGRATYYRLSITARSLPDSSLTTAAMPPSLRGGSGSHADSEDVAG